MVANMVFRGGGHEAVDRTSCSREPLQSICTFFSIIERAQNGLHLPDGFRRSVDKVQFVSRCM